MNIENFIIMDGNGNELESDASGVHLAFTCDACDHPIIASGTIGERGSCEEIPSVCKGCHETYFMDVREHSEKLYVFNIRELNAQ